MNKEQILQEVATKLDVEVTSLSETTRFKEDLGADSIDLMDFIVDIEEEHGFTIEDEKLATISTIGDLIKVAETL